MPTSRLRVVIEISRRRFFLGMGAVAAMAALPPMEIVSAIAAPPPVGYRWRKIKSIEITFENTNGINHRADIDITIRELRLSFNMGTQAIYRWLPMPLEEPVLMADTPIEIAILSPVGIGVIYLIVEDKVDDGPAISMLETHTFPQDGERTVIQHFLELDNSLEARLKSQVEIASRSPIDWDNLECDDDDLEYDDDDEVEA